MPISELSLDAFVMSSVDSCDGLRLARPALVPVARYLLDHPEVVAGRRVLDVASGSGLVAIAAARAGATQVTANDIDPYALAAVTMNARANDVTIGVRAGDLLDGSGEDAEVVLAGDVFYSPELAGPMLAFLERAAARGARVLVGDPGRDHATRHGLEAVTEYHVPTPCTPEDAMVTSVQVLRPTFS